MTKDTDNKSIEVIVKVLINEPDNKSTNEPDNKSIHELDNSLIVQLIKRSIVIQQAGMIKINLIKY